MHRHENAYCGLESTKNVRFNSLMIDYKPPKLASALTIGRKFGQQDGQLITNILFFFVHTR